MPHRELKDWERCALSPMTSAHTWQFGLEEVAEGPKVIVARCLHCRSEPPVMERDRLVTDFRTTKEAAEASRRLHEAQRLATHGKQRRLA